VLSPALRRREPDGIDDEVPLEISIEPPESAMDPTLTPPYPNIDSHPDDWLDALFSPNPVDMDTEPALDPAPLDNNKEPPTPPLPPLLPLEKINSPAVPPNELPVPITTEPLPIEDVDASTDCTTTEPLDPDELEPPNIDTTPPDEVDDDPPDSNNEPPADDPDIPSPPTTLTDPPSFTPPNDAPPSIKSDPPEVTAPRPAAIFTSPPSPP